MSDSSFYILDTVSRRARREAERGKPTSSGLLRLFKSSIFNLQSSFILLLALLATPQMIQAQFAYNHPELEWKTIEGEHFIVHYHENVEWTANEALYIADDVYDDITTLYGYEPEEKTHLIIRDTDDFANGAAYYFDNKMEIWAMPLDYDLRGSHYWLRDVITHEFTHIISLRAARKFRGNIPSAYFQLIEYEPERREDVLYGYPSGIMAYPLPSVLVPMWWAEGVAQFQSNASRFDWWDGIRDMIVRDRVYHDKLMNFQEMDGFGKVGIGNESVYNQGFLFVNYLGERFGEDIVQQITDALTKKSAYSFYKVMEDVTGESPESLYADWYAMLSQRYDSMYPLGESETDLDILQGEGAANHHPQWNPVDSTLAYVSSAGQTYMSRLALWRMDASGEHEEFIPQAEGFDWAPDGDYLVFARKEFQDVGIPEPRSHHPEHMGLEQPYGACDRCDLLLSGSRFADLFYVHKDSLEEERRLTHGERVKLPAISPDGEQIAFINLRDGTNNLALAFPDFPDSVRQLTFFPSGTQVYTVKWAPDGASLIFDHTDGNNRDISIYDLDSMRIRPLHWDIWDERDPVFLNDSVVVYSDDRSGIFNLYEFNLLTGIERRITHVNGGAFQPEPAGDWLYYSLYDSLGYKIARLNWAERLDASTEARDAYLQRIPAVAWERHPKDGLASDYTIQYGPMFLVPRIQLELDRLKNKTIVKPGFYFFSNEILNKYLVLGSVGVATNRDVDIFLLAEYHGLLPTITAEFYHMIRNTQEELLYFNGVWPAESDLKFDLTQGILALNMIIPKYTQLTLDISAGNYRTTIQEHIVGNIQQGGISYDYYRGWDWGLKWRQNRIALRQERDINPSGYWLEAKLRDNHHSFLTGFGFNEDTGQWGNIFAKYHYFRTDLSGFYGHLLPTRSPVVISNRMDVSFIDHNGVDDFFWDFAGGLPGLKGYPFYSLKGTRKVVSTTTLRFPLFRDAYKRVAQLTLRDAYLGLHAQLGSAWTGASGAERQDLLEGGIDDLIADNLYQSRWIKDVGIDLRVNWFSWYAFPTAMEFGAYYGLDEVVVDTENSGSYTYGNEWRYYWRLLFNFN